MTGRVTIKEEPMEVKQEPAEHDVEAPPGVDPEPPAKRPGGDGDGRGAKRRKPSAPSQSQPQLNPLPFEMVVVKEEPAAAADEDAVNTAGRSGADASSLVECLYTGGESTVAERGSSRGAISPPEPPPPRLRNQTLVVQGRELPGARGGGGGHPLPDERDTDGRRRPVFPHEMALDVRHPFFTVRPQVFSTGEERPLVFHAGFPGERPPFVPLQRSLFPQGGLFETRPPFPPDAGGRPFLPFVDGRPRIFQGERALLLGGQGERVPLQCDRPAVHRTLTRGDQGGRVLLHRDLGDRINIHNERPLPGENIFPVQPTRRSNADSESIERVARPSPLPGRASPVGGTRTVVQAETAPVAPRERPAVLRTESPAVQRESGETTIVPPPRPFLQGDRPFLQGDTKELKDFSVRCTPRSEFDIFGEHVASQLQQLPLHTAIELQRDIQNLITEARLGVLKNREASPAPADTAPATSATTAPTTTSPTPSTATTVTAATTPTTTTTPVATASTSAASASTNDPYGRIQVHFHVGS